MIKFFRKIRQRLLAENKFSKYLVYAIGEILLVMIGILLAVNVNRWIEERKTASLEIVVLQELKKNLLVDIENMEYNISIHEKTLESAQIISNAFENTLPYYDSLDYNFSSVLLVPLFFPTTTAFENLKKNGTDLVKNDSLRFEIIDLYELNYSWLKQWIDSEREKQNKDLRELYRKNFSFFDYFGKTHPVNYEKLMRDQEYIGYIYQQINMTNYSLDMYNMNKKNAIDLVRMIDKELDKLQ